MIHQFFREVQDRHGIKGKDLAEKVGINAGHLSQFRSGKASITLELLWRLVEAMDELSPGARKDFGLMLAGCNEEEDVEITRKLETQDLSKVLIAVAKTLQEHQLVRSSAA
jgi:transcriptional regulator with XRE-family HTH domain